MKRKTLERGTSTPRTRYWVVVCSFAMVSMILTGRAFYLQVFNADYLKKQGNARFVRVLKENAVRGMIMDRNGVPLAISTPVDSVWVHPSTFLENRKQWPLLAKALNLNEWNLKQSVRRSIDREFMYLKRHINPETARIVMALKVPGVSLQREYRRYYPTGAVSGHVIGFTDIDDQGQEGLELAYDFLLKPTAGRKKVLKDRYGNTVETLESLSLPVAGKNISLSLDRRIQYLAYRETMNAIKQHKARGASVVVLDARTGEVLAMVNAPGFNPNSRSKANSALLRNRTVTDVFEPGSTFKPFTIAAALESGKYFPHTPINTAPGVIRIGQKTISDARNYGLLTVSGVIEKSSNVGAAKIALSLTKERLWDIISKAGFGQPTGSGLPAESSGLVNPPKKWFKMDQAALSFGYGISVTTLQLARAYVAIANDGLLPPISMLKRKTEPEYTRAFSAETAGQLRSMLELAVSTHGTGSAARVRHYRVAGKTGTVHKLTADGYAEDHYVALFAGMVPASNPRLVMVVVVDDPQAGKYFGGQVAAPIFSRVMTGALRVLNIAPDGLDNKSQWVSKKISEEAA